MKLDASKICFGLTEELDRDSLKTFLQLCGRPQFAETFCSRLSSDEIIQLADQVMGLLRKHLNESEYHRLFLNDPHHNHEE